MNNHPNARMAVLTTAALFLSLTILAIIGSAGAASAADVPNTGATPESGVAPLDSYGDLEYDLINGDTEVRITGYTGSGGDVTIPDTIEGRPVTTIGDSAFEGCTSLTSVTIPDSVTTIGESVFEGCMSLTSIDIPDNVTIISDLLFFECTSLTSVTIPDSVTTIGEWAFGGCSGLTSITIPDSVTTIEWSAFSACTGLTSVTIGDNVTAIGSFVFYGCTGLTSVTIGDSVTVIGNYSFEGCTSLTSITIPDSVTTIGDSVFFECTGLTSVTMGDNVTIINDRAFYQCTSLTFVTIPDSVTTIGESVFYGCTGLTSVNIGDNVTAIGSFVFYGCTGLTSITIPDSVTTIEYSAFSACTGLTSVTMGDNVTTIGGYAFAYCPGLARMRFEGDAPTMGEAWAANHDPSLTVYYHEGSVGFTTPEWEGLPCYPMSVPDAPGDLDVVSGPGYVNLTWSTPYDCGSSLIHYSVYRDGGFVSNVTTLWYNDTTVVAGDWYEYNVTAINVIGEGPIATVGAQTVPAVPGSFTATPGPGYVNLTWTAPLDGGSTITQFNLYRNGTSLFTTENLWFNDTMVVAGNEYTYNVTAVNDIGEGAHTSNAMGHTVPAMPGDFDAMPGPGYVNLTWSSPANGGLEITYNVYRDNNLLGTPTDIWYNDTTVVAGFSYTYHVSAVNAVGEGEASSTFVGELEYDLINVDTEVRITGYTGSGGDVTIPDTIEGRPVTTIGVYAFRGCDGLTSVTIGDNVTTIDIFVFYACGALTSVTIGDNVTTIGDHAFSNCMGLTRIFFDGDAPTVGTGWAADHNSSLTVFYNGGSAGFTTPTWEGLPCYPFGVPAVPVDPDAVSGPGYVNLTWSAPLDGGSMITAYNVYRDGSLVSSQTDIWYNDTTVVAGQSYTYHVRAVNTIGAGPNATADGHTVPAVPGSFTETPGPGYVNVTWSAPLDGGSTIIGYNVYRNGTSLGTTSNECYNDTTVVAGNDHNYTLTAVNDVGESAHTANVTGSTVPTAATLTGVAKVRSNSLSWAFDQSGIWSDEGRLINVTVLRDGVVIAEMAPTATSYVDVEIEMGVTYVYSVYANDTIGDSTMTDVTIKSLDVPSEPTGLVAVPSLESLMLCNDPIVSLDWTAPNDGGSAIDHYVVYRDGGDGLVEITETTDTSFVDDDVDNGTEYGYAVSAVNAIGEGPASTVTVFVPDTIAPTVNITSPSDGAVIASYDITVEWTANDTASGLASFNVTIDDITTEHNASIYSLTFTLAEGPHTVIVTAYDVAGNSANSTVGFTIVIKPTVIDHSPTGDDASKDASIVIEFSELMDQDSVSVICGSVILTPSWNGIVVTLTHDAFDANTTYTVVVNGNDSHDNAMDEYTWSFTTESVVTVTGVVSNGDGPVVNATVALDSGETTTTDSEGRYTLTTTPGEHTITVTKDGFDTVTQTVTLTKSTVQTLDEELLPTTSSMVLWIGVIVAMTVVAAIAVVIHRRQ